MVCIIPVNISLMWTRVFPFPLVPYCSFSIRVCLLHHLLEILFQFPLLLPYWDCFCFAHLFVHCLVPQLWLAQVHVYLCKVCLDQSLYIHCQFHHHHLHFHCLMHNSSLYLLHHHHFYFCCHPLLQTKQSQYFEK